MNQWRIILTLVIVALGAGAIWLWHEGSRNTVAAAAGASAPVQQPQVAAADRAVVGDASTATPPSTPAAESASSAPEDNHSKTNAAVEPPNVDTPEPAARKFANGGRPESDQN
jgi:hypothetical protein